MAPLEIDYDKVQKYDWIVLWAVLMVVLFVLLNAKSALVFSSLITGGYVGVKLFFTKSPASDSKTA